MTRFSSIPNHHHDRCAVSVCENGAFQVNQYRWKCKTDYLVLTMSSFSSISFSHYLVLATILRLLLIAYSHIQDNLLKVKYTDIDYSVFTDGAYYVSQGRSPFLRYTYRYTPLLAWLMLPNIYLFRDFGKILFSVLDLFCGYIIYSTLKQFVSKNVAKISANVWLFNPLTLVVSTRGSSESVISLLVLMTIWYITKRKFISAGTLFGFVVHFKLYPVIYAPVIYLALTKNNKLLKALLPNHKKLKFFLSALLSFALPTYWSWITYGKTYIEEAWLYHFYRKDPQHNFSPYFYTYHLTKNEAKQKIFAYCAFLPQILFLLYLAFRFGVGRKYKMQDLIFSMFMQTFIFVALNKVITSQYFLWYLCLLPLVLPWMKISAKNWLFLTLIWLLGQGQWLLPAYLYEFQKWNCLFWVWIASCVFLLINLYMFFTFFNSYEVKNKIKK